jgi:hypothetical protein
MCVYVLVCLFAVDLATGRICASVLSANGWSPSYSLRPLLLGLQSLLDDPNTTSPLNAEAATLYTNKSRTAYWARVYEVHERNMSVAAAAAAAAASGHEGHASAATVLGEPTSVDVITNIV